MAEDLQAELQELCAYWQSVLRLQDWDIRVKVSRLAEMPEAAQGYCTWTLETKQATIQVLDPSDYEGLQGENAALWPQDLEATLVHELLHVHFAYIAEYGSGRKFRLPLEQAIEAITHGLVRLKRQATGQQTARK